MQTLTVQVNNRNALKALLSLEEKHFIKIVDDTNLHSPALPGNPLSLKAFKNWIADTEAVSTLSLKDAKQKWASKRKQLVKLTK